MTSVRGTRSAFEVRLRTLEPARTAHAAMVAGLAARLDVADLLPLEELHQLRHGLVNAETLLARMHRRNIRAAQPVSRVAAGVRRRAFVVRRARGRRSVSMRVVVVLVVLRCAFGRARRVMCDVRFDLGESLPDLRESGAKRGEFIADVCGRVSPFGRRGTFPHVVLCQTSCDTLGQ